MRWSPWLAAPSMRALVLTCIVAAGPAQVRAALPESGDTERASLAQALYNAAITKAAVARDTRAEVAALVRDIERLRIQLSPEIDAVVTPAAPVKEMLARLARAQERLVATLAQRNRAYFRESDALHDALLDLASTSEGALALRRRHADDAVGLRAVQLQIVEERTADIELADDRSHPTATPAPSRQKDLLDSLAAIGSAEDATQLDASATHDWVDLARLYRKANRPARAQEAAERAVQKAVVDAQLSLSLTELGDALMAQNQWEAARGAYEKSVEIDTRLLAESPASPETQRNLAIGHDRLGDVQIKLGDAAGATARYRASLDLARRLAAAQPDAPRPLRELSLSLDNLGRVMLDRGYAPATRTIFQESLDIARRLAAAGPPSVEKQQDVADGLQNLGTALEAMGDLRGAGDSYTESFDIYRRLLDENPESVALQRAVSLSLVSIGDLLKKQGNPKAASGRYKASLDIDMRLAERDPASRSLQRSVSVSLTRLADVLAELGNLPGARTLYEGSLDISRRLAEADPRSLKVQRDIGIDLQRLGYLLVKQGRLDAARARFRESLAISMRLADADPASARVKRDVWVNLWALAKNFPDPDVSWQQVVDAIEAQQHLGPLTNADARSLELARQYVVKHPAR